MLHLITTKFKAKIIHITTYAATLLYLEIMYIMFTLLLVYGKAVAVSIGFVLAIALTAHIFLLYFKKQQNIKIHLLLIEIHAAYAFSFIIRMLFIESTMSFTLGIIFIIRTLLFIIEALLIYLLTDEQVAERWYT